MDSGTHLVIGVARADDSRRARWVDVVWDRQSDTRPLIRRKHRSVGLGVAGETYVDLQRNPLGESVKEARSVPRKLGRQFAYSGALTLSRIRYRVEEMELGCRWTRRAETGHSGLRGQMKCVFREILVWELVREIKVDV